MKKLMIVAMLCTSPAFAEEPTAVTKMWQKKCKKCHGDGDVATRIGIKMGAPESLNESTKGKTIDEILESLVAGKNKMPSFEKKMTEDELREMASYLELASKVKKVIE